MTNGRLWVILGVVGEFCFFICNINYCKNSGTTKYFGYDSLGNITVYKGTSATSGSRLYWTRGNMLESGSIKDNKYFNYTYGPDNLRYKKTVNGVETTEYYWDGDRLVGEKTGSTITQYIYDASGIIGMKYNNIYYYFENTIIQFSVL